MANREKHCSFKRLNVNGKCIADCAENRLREWETDCTGKAGETYGSAYKYEARVSCGFIDGRGVVVDSRGYRVLVPIAPEPGKHTEEEDSEVFLDNHKQPYVWTTTPNGIRYKKYLGIGTGYGI